MNGLAVLVITCLLLTVGIGLCTFLFLSLKQEVCEFNKRLSSQQALVEHATRELRAEIASLQGAMTEIERRAGELPQLSAPRPAMNTTRRSQILRMHRRGEPPERISAALGIPKGEIELLLKVHQVAAVT